MLELSPLRLLQAKAVFFPMNMFSTHRRFFIPVFLVFCLITFNQNVFSQEDKDPVQIFNQGQDAHEKGDYKTALKLYEEALRIAPEFPEAEYQRGNALQLLGRDSEAEKAFRRAMELRENWVLPITNLGEILVRNGKFDEAETILNKAIELDERNSTAYVALTELRLKTNTSPEILRTLLNKLNNFQNPDGSIWTARGALERSLDDKASAKKSLRQALSLEAKNSYALAEMTEILLAEKSFDEALTTAQNLVKLYPHSASANLLLARVFANRGNVTEALNILDLLDSQNSEVTLLRNEIIAKGSQDVGTLEKQLENDQKNPIVLGRLCLLTRTNPSKALEYCRRASEADPQNVGHAVGFGAALVQAKQYDGAVNLFRRLLPHEPDNFAIHANLATALFELKRYAEAKAEFQWLIEKKSDLAVAYYFLAIAHDNLAEYGEALTNYQKFLQTADSKQNQLEIDKVNLRLPILEKQIKQSGKEKKKT